MDSRHYSRKKRIELLWVNGGESHWNRNNFVPTFDRARWFSRPIVQTNVPVVGTRKLHIYRMV